MISASPRARLFTAGRVEPDADTVIEEEIAAESVLEGPPRSLVLTVGPQLTAAYGKKVPQLWSPPLDDPIPLDSILTQAQESPQRPGSALWWPLGEIDRPRQLSHGLLRYSLDEGNVSVLGMRKDEASSVVQTFVLSAASRYSPTEVGFYLMSYGGPALGVLRDLPHVGAIGGEGRREVNLRLLGDLEAILMRRRRLFQQHNILSVEEWRRKRQAGDAGLDDGFPTDLFVIVDGWENFIDDNTSILNPKNPQVKNIETLISGGHGVHVVITASDWIKLGNVIQNQINARYELKLANAANSQVRARIEDKMIRPQDRIPADQPGRGITSTGDVIRFAIGRTDGQATMDDLDTKVRETVQAITDRYAGHRRAPGPRLLPTRVEAHALPSPRDLGGERHALGVRGRDLQPMIVDFATDPLLAVFGDDHHGKSSFILNTIASITAGRESPNEAIVVLFDPKRRLGEATRMLVEPRADDENPADFYETDFNVMARRVDQIATILDKRQPPSSSGWEQRRAWTYEGPKIYLIVDDLDAVPLRQQMHQQVTAGAPAGPGMAMTVATWEPLLRHLPNAADRGLRVIVTHRAAELMAAEVQTNGIPHHLSTQPSTRILLGARSDRDKVGGVKFEVGLPPGRGQVVGGSQDNAGYVQLTAPPQ